MGGEARSVVACHVARREKRRLHRRIQCRKEPEGYRAYGMEGRKRNQHLDTRRNPLLLPRCGVHAHEQDGVNHQQRQVVHSKNEAMYIEKDEERDPRNLQAELLVGKPAVGKKMHDERHEGNGEARVKHHGRRGKGLAEKGVKEQGDEDHRPIL